MSDDLQNNRALLPAGLRGLFRPLPKPRRRRWKSLMEAFAGHGYQRIKPPLLEFEDSLLSGSGTAVAEQTFRLMDPVSQRMMGLRADTTPQVARWPRSSTRPPATAWRRARGSGGERTRSARHGEQGRGHLAPGLEPQRAVAADGDHVGRQACAGTARRPGRGCRRSAQSTSTPASPRPRWSARVHTALISMYPSIRMRWPAMATSSPSSRTPR